MLYLVNIILGALGAWFIGHFGGSLSLINYPDGRSSHRVATPRGGGIGIFAAFLLTCLLIDIPLAFWLPVTIISLLGFCADCVELTPKLRLYVQFIAAVALILGMKYIQTNLVIGMMFIPLWAIFMVGTSNFYNFMDGINGIASITGFVAFGLLSLYLYLSGINTPFVALAACISFSCLGFLPFNMPQAKVFLGDVGSVPLGFVFAAMVFVLSEEILDFVCFASLLFPFYIDELTTMAVRLKGGEKITQAHRKHLYQLFANEKGIAHWKISLSYGLLQLIVGGNVLLLKNYGILPVLLFLGLCSFGFIWVNICMRQSLSGEYR